MTGLRSWGSGAEMDTPQMYSVFLQGQGSGFQSFTLNVISWFQSCKNMYTTILLAPFVRLPFFMEAEYSYVTLHKASPFQVSFLHWHLLISPTFPIF